MLTLSPHFATTRFQDRLHLFPNEYNNLLLHCIPGTLPYLPYPRYTSSVQLILSTLQCVPSIAPIPISISRSPTRLITHKKCFLQCNQNVHTHVHRRPPSIRLRPRPRPNCKVAHTNKQGVNRMSHCHLLAVPVPVLLAWAANSKQNATSRN